MTRGRCPRWLVGIVVLLSTAVPAVLVIAPAMTATTEESADQRHALRLGPAERKAVMAEMRTMLQSMSRILHGLTRGDSAMVETAARTSGMASALNAQVQDKLPAHFVQLASKTHRRFDELASASAQRDKTLVGLAMIAGYCVSCHDTYRVEEAR